MHQATTIAAGGWQDKLQVALASEVALRQEAAAACGRSKPHRPTNRRDVVTVQDELGFGAMVAVSERGLRPGVDIAVTGFDDTPAAAFVWPGLTTVRQPFEMVAQALVNLLVDRIENPEGAPGSSMLVPRLVIRGSTSGSEG